MFFIFLILGTRSLVRVYDTPKSVAGLDIVGARRGEWFDIVVTPEKLNDLSGKTRILAQDIEVLERSLAGYYHSYPGFVDTFMQIAIDHPNIAKLDTIGVSWEGREILAMKISDNVGIDEDETELVFIGLHHAREWPALEIPLFFADTLARAYGNDPHITNLINEKEIWIIPCINPDGYVYCHDEGNDWRKNRRPLPNGDYGVDPNRNYDGSCDGNPWGAWGGVFGSGSHGTDRGSYCGPLPFSETETQAIRNLVLAHNFTFCVSYHTYGEMVVWAWHYTTHGVPDSILIAQIGENMASQISRQWGGGTYDAFQASSLYPTTGDADDWFYGHGLFVEGKNTLAYTVEACNLFHPSPSGLNQVVRENFDGAIYLCDIADSIRDLLVPRIIPPAIGQLDTNSGDYEINWEKRLSDKYTLQELQGFSAVRDSAEEVSMLWILDGFTRNTARAHSGSYSYFGGDDSNMVTSMTTKYPLPLMDSLVFWVWYNLQINYDYAFVEVSPTGREWEILDSFNEASLGWKRKAYQLPTYNSLFLRFRYATDHSILEEGFFVDDIYPVTSFDSIATISESIIDTFYLMADKSEGTYWYCVKGHNSRGWSDFCVLEDIVVMEPGIAEKEIVKPFMVVSSENPFSRRIKINYGLPIGISGSLKIYDSVGRFIRTFPINDSRLMIHEVAWNAQGFASGIYFVVLDSKDFRKSLKITLIH